MAKLKTDEILSEDLVEYLDSYSDFSFELKVLKMLRTSDINCEHGGYYEDPVTKKSREFDIRAIKTIQQYRVRMAIECKNIRDNFPILVSCIPRHEQESYHQIAFSCPPKTNSYKIANSLGQSRATTFRILQQHSFYKAGEPVGKSTAQIGRDTKGRISANDGEIYEKWGQCLSSVDDPISDMYWDGDDDKKTYYSAVFPFVVLPDERLWMITYDNDGHRNSDPFPTNHCSCYINKDYEMGTTSFGTRTWLWLSHIEIVTFEGMKAFVETYLQSKEGMEKIFPQEGIMEALSRQRKK